MSDDSDDPAEEDFDGGTDSNLEELISDNGTSTSFSPPLNQEDEHSSSTHSKSELNQDGEQNLWTVEQANLKLKEHRRLLDRPEEWNETIRKAIESSPRLQKLIKHGRRNKIVSLPPVECITRQFYCAICGEIPFPWAPDPIRVMRNKLSDPDLNQLKLIEPLTYLCSNGHVICRTCYLSYSYCTMSTSDLDYIYGKETSKGPGELHAEAVDELKEPIATGSIGNWGQSKACMAPLTEQKCPFFTEVLKYTEFACKYFYEFCSFRGKGDCLNEHEKECPYATAYPGTYNHDEYDDDNDEDTDSDSDNTSSSSTEVSSPSPSEELGGTSIVSEEEEKDIDDDDDAAILSVDVTTIRSEISQKISNITRTFHDYYSH